MDARSERLANTDLTMLGLIDLQAWALDAQRALTDAANIEQHASAVVNGQRNPAFVSEWQAKAVALGYDGVADLLWAVERGEPPMHVAALLAAAASPQPAPQAVAGNGSAIELWYFRDLSSEQRLSLLRLHGYPTEEIGEVHAHQRRAFRAIFSSPAQPTDSEWPIEGWGRDIDASIAARYEAANGSLPPLPQAFFDEFGKGADDRVQDYARAAIAAYGKRDAAGAATMHIRPHQVTLLTQAAYAGVLISGEVFSQPGHDTVPLYTGTTGQQAVGDAVTKVAAEILSYAHDEAQCWDATNQKWIIYRSTLIDWAQQLAPALTADAGKGGGQ